MTTPHGVRLATPDEAAMLGRTLADAFAEDPVFAWLIPPGVRHRERRMTSFFTGMAGAYLTHGKQAYVAEDGGAVALWADPAHSWRLAVDFAQTRTALSAFGARGVLRALRTQLHVERLHPEGRHWYLGYLGTRRDRQGSGLGAALLETVLVQADRDGATAYLESSNQRNLTLYRRHGFEVVEEIRLLGSGPQLWRMARPASGAGG